MPSSDPLESKSPSSSSASSTANSPLNESIPSDQQSFFLPPPPPPPPSSSSSAAAASLSMLSAFVPSLLMRTANGLKTESTTTTGNLIDCSTSSPFSLLCHQPDNYRNWLMLQEIVRNNDLLKQFQPTFPPLQPLPIDTDDESEQENDDDDDEEEEDGDDDDDLDDDENFTNSDEIPLDLSMKMDSNHHDIDQTSITISNKQQQSSSSSSTKHTKTALTPLREQDTSKYRYINTMELVQTVKDILSRYSISQRHFGEKILGLSQGSVSDILARPKQWELLTQKGREPFLRMRIFLDDPNAIKQLVQTVSTTPTTNTSSILLPTFCPPLPPSSSSSSLLSTPSLLSNSTLNGFHSNNLLTKDNSTDSQSNILTNDSSQILINENIQSLPAISSSSPSNGITTTTTTNSNKSKSRSKNSKTTNEKSSNQSRNSSTNPLMTPYELPKISLPSKLSSSQFFSHLNI
jgi:homeobox protein cut-like